MGAVKALAMDLELMAEYLEGWEARLSGKSRTLPPSYSVREAMAYQLGYDEAYWADQLEPCL